MSYILFDSAKQVLSITVSVAEGLVLVKSPNHILHLAVKDIPHSICGRYSWKPLSNNVGSEEHISEGYSVCPYCLTSCVRYDHKKRKENAKKP